MCINGHYRSGINDTALISAAAARGEPEPPTARGELAKVAAKVLVLSVGGDPESPRSLSLELAKNIPGASFEEVVLPDPSKAGMSGRCRESGSASRAATPGVDAGFLPTPLLARSPSAATSPLDGGVGSLLSSSQGTMLGSPLAPRQAPPGPRLSQSLIPARRAVSRHCFEAHSGIVVPRVMNWLLLHGTPAHRGADGECDDGKVRIVSPLRTGMAVHHGPIVGT